jgi:NitT/TauT family transport system permease protein
MKISTMSAEAAKKRAPGRQRALKCVKALGALAFWLALWQIAALRTHNPLLIPYPAAVAARLCSLALGATFWGVIGQSLLRIMAGFILGVIGGLLMAVLTSVSRPANILVSPALKAVLATPVASFIILLIIWFQPGLTPSLVAMLVVLPMVWRHIHGGVAALDGQLLEMARHFSLPRLRRLRRLYVPGLIPPFLSACSVGVGLAWKSGVAAEVISYSRLSIGGELKAGQTYLQTADVFVWTIVVIVLSLLIERLLTDLFRRLNQQEAKN